MKSILIIVGVVTIVVIGTFVFIISTKEEPNIDQQSTPRTTQTVSPTPALFYHLQYTSFAQSLAKPNTVLLDVRTKEEFTAGHIEGAINVDFYAGDFRDQLNKLDKSKTYAVYCRTANRSGQALTLMQQLGFSSAYDLIGGIAAWKGTLVTK
jgi:rhodanese-related sulfurtransferase